MKHYPFHMEMNIFLLNFDKLVARPKFFQVVEFGTHVEGSFASYYHWISFNNKIITSEGSQKIMSKRVFFDENN